MVETGRVSTFTNKLVQGVGVMVKRSSGNNNLSVHQGKRIRVVLSAWIELASFGMQKSRFCCGTRGLIQVPGCTKRCGI